jgi:hypothetical protein
MNDQKPIPLDKLNEHLRSNRNTGDAPVVDMGRIIVPKRPYMKWAAAFAMVMVLGVGSMATYNAMSTKEMTLLVDVNQGVPSQALTQMMSEIGGEIIAVKQNEDSTYEVKVVTRKSKNSFLDWLRKNKDVKKATELPE